MVNVGIAGLGFMGMIHYLAYQKVRGVRVRAICEQDAKRLAGDWRSIKGNFGPQGTKMDLAGIARYPDLKKMMADPNLDVIDICLPPAAHAKVAVAALKAGKHVFCEKPIALNPTDANRMVNTAQRVGKMLLIGHVLPFFPPYRYAHQTIASGKYGRLMGAHLKRVISDPVWMTDFWVPDRSGGPMIDLNIHDAHFVRLLCGMPRAVQTVGRMRGEVVELFHTQFLFEDPSLFITVTGGTINQQGRAFTNAYEIYLEEATLLFDWAAIGKTPTPIMPVTVLTNNGRVSRPKLGSGDPVDGFVAELTEMTRSIRTGNTSQQLDGQLARDAIVLCQKQTQSAQRQRAVKV